MSNASDRKFNEDEVGRLLQLAIRRQEEVKETRSSLDQGLTLDEIERIAQEVGIEPKHLRYALTHLNDLPEKKSGFHFWGTPTVLESEIEVKGQLSEEAMIDMLAEIRETFKTSRGTFENLKHSFSWNNSAVTVQAQPVGDNTAIHLKEKMDSPIIAAHLWWMLTLLLGMMIFLGKDQTLFTFSMTVGIASFFYAIGWFINRHLMKKKESNNRDLLSKLHEISAAHNQPVIWSYDDVPPSQAAEKRVALEDVDSYQPGKISNRAPNKTKSS